MISGIEGCEEDEEGKVSAEFIEGWASRVDGFGGEGEEVATAPTAVVIGCGH